MENLKDISDYSLKNYSLNMFIDLNTNQVFCVLDDTVTEVINQYVLKDIYNKYNININK